MSNKRGRWAGFYFITDSGLSERGIIEDVRNALSVGVAMVQYREKTKSYEESTRKQRASLRFAERRVCLLS